MTLTEKYKPVLDVIMKDYGDKTINRAMAVNIHLALVAFGMKAFPELSSGEINAQAQFLITDLINRQRQG